MVKPEALSGHRLRDIPAPSFYTLVAKPAGGKFSAKKSKGKFKSALHRFDISHLAGEIKKGLGSNDSFMYHDDVSVQAFLLSKVH